MKMSPTERGIDFEPRPYSGKVGLSKAKFDEAGRFGECDDAAGAQSRITEHSFLRLERTRESSGQDLRASGESRIE